MESYWFLRGHPPEIPSLLGWLLAHPSSSLSQSGVVPVTDEEYQLLAPIKCLPDRLALSKNKDALLVLAKLKVEDQVRVTILLKLDSPSISLGTTSCAATVKYIGEIEGEVGRHFGVQIKVCTYIQLSQIQYSSMFTSMYV